MTPMQEGIRRIVIAGRLIVLASVTLGVTGLVMPIAYLLPQYTVFFGLLVGGLSGSAAADQATVL